MKYIPDIGAIVILVSWITGIIENLSPIIKFLTICGGFLIMVISLYIKIRQVRKWWKENTYENTGVYQPEDKLDRTNPPKTQ